MHKKQTCIISTTTVIIFMLACSVLQPMLFNKTYASTEFSAKFTEFQQNPFGIHAAGGQYEMLTELKAGRRLIVNLMSMWNKKRIEALDYDIFKSDYGIYITFNSKTKDLELTKYYLLNQSELQQAVENTRKLVERYDGDEDYGCPIKNKKDCYAPGDCLYPREELINVLKQRPVRYWQVENEWLWQILDPKTNKPASNEQLLNQLKIISAAIKEANPKAKVIMGAFSSINKPAALDGYNANGYIEIGYIDCKYQKIYLDNPTPKQTKRAKNEKERILFFLEKGAPYYDIIDFHSYHNDPVNLGLETEWLKNQLEALGIKSKEIWSMENAGPFYFFNLLGLSREESCNKNVYDDRIHAEHLIKRYVIGIHNGISRIFYSSLWPTKGWQENFTRLSLVDDRRNKKPAYYTYKLMTENLIGFTSIDKIPDQDKTVFIYKFMVNNNPIFIAWSDSGEKIIDLSSYTTRLTLVLTHIVTALDKNSNPVYLENETAASKTIKIKEEPVLIK